MKAFLILEDGTVYEGTSIGVEGSVVSEIVFNTSMTGYLEIFTDPSYAGQGVVMTYPLIGNYGLTKEDQESKKPWVEAVFVHEIAEMESNFRSKMHILEFLQEYNIPGLEGVNTRKLTKELRNVGTMKGKLTSDISNIEEIIKEIQVGIKKTNSQYTCIVDRKKAIKEAIRMASKSDIIVLAGKGHEPYQEINHEKLPFDERVIVNEVIEELDKEQTNKKKK